MARDVSALGGKPDLDQQFPVSFVLLEITGNTQALSTTEYPLWINLTTLAVAKVTTGGSQRFDPTPGISVPDIRYSGSSIVDPVSVRVSNADGAWTTILNAGGYEEAPARILQGDLGVVAGHPDAFTFVGVVSLYRGRLTSIDRTDESATLTIKPHVIPHDLVWPYDRYDLTRYPLMPTPGKVLKFGYDEVRI